MNIILKTALLSSALAFAAPVHAAVIASLTFVQPTGTVFSNQSVDIQLRLTLDPASDALTTDGSGFPTSGYNPADYTGPIDLNDPATRIFLNEGAYCGGSFNNGCNPGAAYDFNFNYAQPNFISPLDFDLQPGESYEWLFGSFSPVGGNAAAGTYTFFNASALIEIYNPGPDPLSGSDDQYGFITFAQTCPGQEEECTFSRDVIAAPGGVPEPASWAMMLAGFGLVGAAARRRAKVAVTYA
jgi:PEP-CTERM motif